MPGEGPAQSVRRRLRGARCGQHAEERALIGVASGKEIALLARASGRHRRDSCRPAGRAGWMALHPQLEAAMGSERGFAPARSGGRQDPDARRRARELGCFHAGAADRGGRGRRTAAGAAAPAVYTEDHDHVDPAGSGGVCEVLRRSGRCSGHNHGKEYARRSPSMPRTAASA